jgi:RimJ/RimL family protein N-acetyltransferase
MTVPLQSATDVQHFVDEALRARDAGTALPFATVLQATGQIVGSTRYLNVEPSHRRVEIGATFIGTAWQRTAVNTEAKYLMLWHAFERLACHRVEFKTDSLNEPSRRAILRLGATEEGTLRSHMLVAGGRLRDTVYFSIIRPEWPTIKASLEAKLAAHRT